ncbi:hypothetical protein BDZ88DRAFT_423932 [Geranomyces variabilis]|nr:hypothetical protein BDZ88DRAFT_423932 [Geranomyces variabilis]KAJ3137733.1 hypothetical protein HDU90_001684 [Geranomyces variabilis]
MYFTYVRGRLRTFWFARIPFKRESELDDQHVIKRVKLDDRQPNPTSETLTSPKKKRKKRGKRYRGLTLQQAIKASSERNQSWRAGSMTPRAGSMEAEEAPPEKWKRHKGNLQFQPNSELDEADIKLEAWPAWGHEREDRRYADDDDDHGHDMTLVKEEPVDDFISLKLEPGVMSSDDESDGTVEMESGSERVVEVVKQEPLVGAAQ